jgi:pSer/pThr/pTyr-binding forkhead associated (FHA) protein
MFTSKRLRTLSITTSSLVMGRSVKEVDWVILDPNVALKHLEIQNINGDLYIKDLKTLNGTFINDNRIPTKKQIQLSDNDLLQIGSASFTVIGSTLISSSRTGYA